MLAGRCVIFGLLWVALSACDQSSARTAAQSAEVPEAPAPSAQTVPSIYPSFKIDVQLTPAAQERLTSSGDRIGVSFEFATDRGPEPVISHQIELSAPGVIDTKSFALAPHAIAKLGSDYEVQVNGYSVSTTDLNFLHCKIVVEYFKSLRDQTRVLACDLLKLE